MNIILDILIALYLYVIPTIFLNKLILRSKYFYNFILILFGLPLLSFLVAWLFKTVISLKLILLIATSINICLIILSKKQKFKFKLVKKNYLFVAVLLVVFILSFLNFKGLALGYWDTYIILPAVLMTDSNVKITDINGEELYQQNSQSFIPNNLINKEGFGISTKDQRIGSAIFFSIPYLIFGKIGFRIYFALIVVLIFLASFHLSKNIFQSSKIALFSGFLLSLNPYILSVDRLNANLLALLLLTTIISMITEKKQSWIIIGILYGILGGIRNVAILFGPAFIYAMIIDNRFRLKDKKEIRKNFVLFLVGALIFIIPILFWNNFAFGDILMHPTQYQGLYGFRPTFEHNLFGLKFEFNGLLNYPFIDTMVRTPHFAYPTFLTIPLTIIHLFGILLITLSFLGIAYFYKTQKNFFIFLILFSVPFFIFIIFQENWEDVKTTFILLLFNPFIIFITGGFKNFISKKINFMELVKLGIVVIIMILMINLLTTLEFKKDERWFQRFPEAKNLEKEIAYQNWIMRDEWGFFHTDEIKEELDIQKKRLTQGNIFPKYYIDMDFKNIQEELKGEDMILIDVWKYIY